MLVSTRIWTRGLKESKKSENFCLNLSHWVTEALHIRQSKHCLKIFKLQTLYNKYGTLPILHLKCIKDTFSNKQIIEIKKKMHIDSFFYIFPLRNCIESLQEYSKVQIRMWATVHGHAVYKPRSVELIWMFLIFFFWFTWP